MAYGYNGSTHSTTLADLTGLSAYTVHFRCVAVPPLLRLDPALLVDAGPAPAAPPMLSPRKRGSPFGEAPRMLATEIPAFAGMTR